MERIPNSDAPPGYCAVPVIDTDTMTKEIENDTTPNDELLSFEDKNTRLIFTFKVLFISLLQAVEVGVIVMVVIACREVEWADIGWYLLGYATLIYLGTLYLMVRKHLYYYQYLHRTYDYLILVFCPAMVALLILSVLDASWFWYERYLLLMVFVSWLCYVTSAAIVLAFVYYTSKTSLFKGKNTPKSLTYVVACAAFAFTYIGGISYTAYSSNDFGIAYLSGPAITSGFCAYLHHLYVLYDINAMTGSNYRLAMTPDDYVKGAVNLQFDFVFIIKDYFTSFCSNVKSKEEVITCPKDPELNGNTNNSEDTASEQPTVPLSDQTVDVEDELISGPKYSVPKGSDPSSDVPLVHRRSGLTTSSQTADIEGRQNLPQ